LDQQATLSVPSAWALAALLGHVDPDATRAPVNDLTGILEQWSAAFSGSDADRFQNALGAQTRTIQVAGRQFANAQLANAHLDARAAELDARPPEQRDLSFELDVVPTNGVLEVQRSPRRGRGVRFSAKASVIGRQGEVWLIRRLRGSEVPRLGVPPGILGGCEEPPDEVVVLPVATPEQVADARANPHAPDWLQAPELVEYPGFDLLYGACWGVKQVWIGIEVKSSGRPLSKTLRIHWTPNEHNACRASVERPEGSPYWPVDDYVLCAVTRLWSLDAEGTVTPPQVTWVPNPVRLAEARKLMLRRVLAPARYELEVQMRSSGRS